MAGVSVIERFNHLPAIAQKYPVRRRVVMQRRGQQMVEIAQRLSRVDTGEMQRGWEWHETNSGGNLQNAVPHTVFNEYGTRYMSAQPMARPAAEQVFPLIVEDLANESMWLP